MLFASMILRVSCEELVNKESPGGLVPDRKDTRQEEQAHADRIGERIQAVCDAWSSQPEKSRPSYDLMLQKALDPLTHDEIRLIAQYKRDFDIDDEVFRRWARFDPAAALKAIREIEDSNVAEIRLAGTGLEGGPGEAMSGYVFGMYFGAVDGWSQVAPKAAWKSFMQREGAFSKSPVIEKHLYYFYEVLFERLATVDPDLAFDQLIVFQTEEYEEMYKASMLAGYLRGAPRGRDWRKEVERLLERKWKMDWIYSEIQAAMMGRWLEDAPSAAEQWFREGDVEGLHWSYVEPPDPFATRPNDSGQGRERRERQRHDLGTAVGYWAARDFAAAWRWMKSYSGFRREGFERAVLDGAIAFFNEGARGQRVSAREHFLDHLGKLPDQADRDLFALRFANVLWVFDNTQFLGEPPRDKAKWLQGVRESLSALRLSTPLHKFAHVF